MKLSKKQLFAICEIVLGVLALVLLFAPALHYEGLLVEYDWSGYEVFFGTVDWFDASAGGIITFILLLVIVCAGVLKFFMPKQMKIFNFIIIVCGVLAGIFLFMGCTDFMANIAGDDVKFSDVKDYYDLGAGAIVSAIFALCAAAVACLDEFFVKK
ncbi:MAG: hypothetical protein K6G48_07580 [Acholeplasmatales bacterium]|nr:hypothetical protein [Acholeplasmatales bacterium]